MKETPTRQWDTHKHSTTVWSQCISLLELWFGEEYLYIGEKYNGQTNPFNYINAYTTTWDI